MVGGFARDFLNAINGVPPSFIIIFGRLMHRSRMPLSVSWAVFGVILPIFCRLALPNQAHWFVNLCMDGLTWCFGRGWDLLTDWSGVLAEGGTFSQMVDKSMCLVGKGQPTENR
ncbi:uncharacterized protein LOC121794068 [Salvia splendens]|uniref:uncharacterized protein LOC121794068 n=1 Tax=Salvia splendens TaxID=180675 RepID=UPI001C27E09F|nr:uncharacterized protein LOC121794068 [Salvia splendens]